MGRQTAIWKSTTCAKGVNQEIEQASFQECADALNVWAPDGAIIQRPGFIGRGHASTGATLLTNQGLFIYEDRNLPVSVFTLALPLTIGAAQLQGSTHPRGDRLYVGRVPYGATGAPQPGFRGYGIRVTAGNTALAYTRGDYWNGTAWVPLDVNELTRADVESTTTLLGGGTGLHTIAFAPPADWVTTTPLAIMGVGAATEMFWVRLTFYTAGGAGVTTLSAGTQVDRVFQTGETSYVGTATQAFSAQFNTAKRYFVIETSAFARTLRIARQHTLMNPPNIQYDRIVGTTGIASVSNHYDYAIIPDTEEVYITNSVRTFYFKGIENYDRTDASEYLGTIGARRAFARVEARDFAVGFDGKYATDLVAQLTGFPQSKYITYFKNRLWVANLESNFSGVRWSAPLPYHNVWPSGQIEYLIENDNSPITGMYGFGEHVRVFKQNSIWTLVDVGSDANELLAITTVKSAGAAGVGCVSQRSIQEIKGHLFFLAEDGIYAFDGVKAEKLSDRINDTMKRIYTQMWSQAVGVHWRTQRLYLLAVALDGSETNNHVLAFDYANNSWWIWDNMEVSSWILDEDSADLERLYFMDRAARVYEMDVGRNDYGAATSTRVKTQKLGFRQGARKRLRHVYVHSNNQTGSVTTQVIPNDDTINTTGRIGTMNFAENTEIGLLQKRERRNDFKVDSTHFQTELTHADKTKKFALDLIDMGVVTLGRR